MPSHTFARAVSETNHNFIIDPDMHFWMEGTEAMAGGSLQHMPTAYRWDSLGTGSKVERARIATDTISIPNNPVYCAKYTMAGQTLTNHFVRCVARIENLRRFSGKTVTFGCYVRSPNVASGLKFALDSQANRGAPASPAVIGSLGVKQFQITNAWQRVTSTFLVPQTVLPEAAADNVGANLQLNFWCSAGSLYDAQTLRLGLQTGVIEIASVFCVLGDDPGYRGVQCVSIDEAAMRLARVFYFVPNAHLMSDNLVRPVNVITFPTYMRVAPTATIVGVSGGTGGTFNTTIAAAKQAAVHSISTACEVYFDARL